MPNKNYIKGYNKELKAKHELEAEGYIVIRSAGSHGACDLVAIDINFIRLIQLKSTVKHGASMTQYRDDVRKLTELLTPLNVRKEIWLWRARKGWDKHNICEYD